MVPVGLSSSTVAKRTRKQIQLICIIGSSFIGATDRELVSFESSKRTSRLNDLLNTLERLGVRDGFAIGRGAATLYSPPWQAKAKRARVTMGLPHERLQDLRPHLEAARASGCQSLRQIAFHLNSTGLCTTRGRPWGPTQVRRAMRRLEEGDRLCEMGVTPITSHRLHEYMQRARSCGCASLREIAHYLDKRGVRPVRGNCWTATQVRRVLHRLDAAQHGVASQPS